MDVGLIRLVEPCICLCSSCAYCFPILVILMLRTRDVCEIELEVVILNNWHQSRSDRSKDWKLRVHKKDNETMLSQEA